MSVRRHLRAFLGERRLSSEIDAVTVKIFNAGSDLDSVRVDPRPPTDPISRVDGWRIG